MGDVIAAAEEIRASGKMQNPLGLAYAPGWELGQGFVNLYLGQDGEFFQPGTALPSIYNEKGIEALETMKALAGYLGPD